MDGTCGAPGSRDAGAGACAMLGSGSTNSSTARASSTRTPWAAAVEAGERHAVPVEDALPRRELGAELRDGGLGRGRLHGDALELGLALGGRGGLGGGRVPVPLLLLLVLADHQPVGTPGRHRRPLVEELSLKPRDGHSAYRHAHTETDTQMRDG